MASGRFTDVPARPTAFLDFRSVTLGESAEFPTRVKGVVPCLQHAGGIQAGGRGDRASWGS